MNVRCDGPSHLASLQVGVVDGRILARFCRTSELPTGTRKPAVCVNTV